MTADTAAMLAGLLFWLIIATNLASNRFGYQTFGDLESEADLGEIDGNPVRFKVGFALIVLEHVCIVLLAAMLFVAFRHLDQTLALVWLGARSTEGVIQMVEKRNYWRLLEVAGQHAAGGGDRSAPAARRLEILRSKRLNFLVAQVLFAVGTFTYSLVFATEGVVPAWLAWAGVGAAVLYGFGSGREIRNPNGRAIWNVGGLLILIYETLLGGWLLFG